MSQSHPSALLELSAAQDRVRLLWAPPPEISIEEWARAKRVLPSDSGRPGEWRADPIQREIQASCCDATVREVVFMKSARLGWSEICNNAMGWGIDVHGMAMLMLQPSRDTAEQYCKDRLDQMIESTPALRDMLLISTSKKASSTTRNKRFSNGGNFFVASAGNPRELRSRRSKFTIGDEADGWPHDVSGEGDPDKIVRRRGDEYGSDFRMLIGSTPAMPTGLSRIEGAYNRSSRGVYRNPCPHCNAMEPFLWRDPGNPSRYLLVYEKDKDNQVIPDSVRWTCIRCGTLIEERWKMPMMEEGHWHHQRPDVLTVKGYWANGLYASFMGHWAKMAQEWVEAQGDQLALKSFINLNLAETFSEPGESVDPEETRRRADLDERDRAVVPDGVAILAVTVDVQTASQGRLEAQVVGFAPDERAYLVDFQIFTGNPQEDFVWEDLDAWLLRGWRHQNGAQMTPHIVLIDARDGNVRSAVFNFCAPRADRWIFPQMGVDTLASKGWCEESSSRKHTQRTFLTNTDDCKRVFFSRLALDLNAPKSVHIPSWTSQEYHEQLGAEKRMPVTDPKTRKTSYRWVQVRPRNEALDLWCYAYSAWWAITKILAPHLGGPDGRGQLEALARTASQAKEEVTYTQGNGRQIRSMGAWNRG
jgi:phage terminase large subunit GpA-like protein